MAKKRIGARRTVVLLLLLCAIFSFPVVSRVYAKYLYTAKDQQEIHTNAFYFESDLLVENGKTYTLNPGTQSMTFDLRNYADELRFSDEDIAYTVTLTGTDGARITVTEGELEKAVKSGQEIKLENLVDGGTYTVTATGKAGFEKTLSATFTVLTAPEGLYMYVQDDPDQPFVLLTVWTDNLIGELTVTPGANLIPDNTWPGMDKLKKGDEITKLLGKYESVTYRFFKGQGYDTNFSVKIGQTTAVSKQPEG